MAREPLIASAVSFLREPSVASSTVNQRIAFLHSKNLTPEEIDAALARAGKPATGSDPLPQNASFSSTPYGDQQFRQAPYGYGSYPTPWGQAPPLPAQRDWRDWFIMATVTTGVGYGLYTAAKRYVLPLISPPTPSQLEADKASIDASFERAFALIDQLSTDTAALKAAEEERTEKLDASLADIEAVIDELKAANRQRDQDARHVADQVRDLREMIPKALNKWKEREDSKLGDLGSEMQSLKRLMENKIGARTPQANSEVNRFGISSGSKTQEAKGSESGQETVMNNELQEEGSKENRGRGPLSLAGSQSPKYRPNLKAAIPAWQMAAVGKDAEGSNGTSIANDTVEASA